MVTLKNLAVHRGGNVAILFALMLPLVIGGAGFGVETAYWYLKHSQLQAVADSAAYAAGLEARAGSSDAQVVNMAKATAADNGFDAATGSIEVTLTKSGSGGQVEVIAIEEAPRFFTAFFKNDDLTFSTRAVAAYNSAASACVLALHSTASGAANFSGSSDLTLNGCSVMANSVAANAVNLQGAAKLSADCVISGGGVKATSGLTMTACGSAITQAAPAADPYANVPAPTPTGGCQPVPNNGSLQPGRYCSGMSIKGTVTLEPGVYYLEGDLSANANANITGSGVTIYLTNGGRVKLNGSAHIDISAPTTGAYAGMLLFGDRNSSGGTNKLLGNAASKMTGAIYFPSQKVEYQGNFSGTNGCTQVVGLLVEWTGNTTVGVDCAAQGMNPIPVPGVVRLTA